MTFDLSALQILDPATYQKILALPVKPLGHYLVRTPEGIKEELYPEAWIPVGELMPEVAQAWLQYCIQEAIATRGWDFSIYYRISDPGRYMVCITIWLDYKNRFMSLDRAGDTPADALLNAYISALKAQSEAT